jgi:hypothetical protein
VGDALVSPRVVAHGRTEACPDSPVTDPRGLPTSDAIRCSYSDTANVGQTRLAGTVFGEDPAAMPGIPLEGVAVRVHELRSDGRLGDEVGHATSDAQGHYHLAVMLEPGDHAVVAVDETGGELGRARFFADDGTKVVDDVFVMIPLDPALRASDAQAEPPEEGVTTRPPPPEFDLRPRVVPAAELPSSTDGAETETGGAPESA